MKNAEPDTMAGDIDRQAGPRYAIPWWVWVGSVNGLVLGAAYAVKSGWTGNKYVRKLPPNWEYTVGNWWSGALLLCFGMLCATVAMHHPRGSRGRWAVGCLSVLGAGLCLDELGSLHERVAKFGPLSKLWNLLPFAVLFAGLAGISLWWVRQNAGLFGRAWIKFLIGFICLSLGEPIDMIEHDHPWPVGLVPFSVVLEEGVEILGSTLLIWGAIDMIRRSVRLSPWSDRATFDGLVWLGGLLLLAAAPLLLLRHSVISIEMLGLSERGDFGAAPVSMMYLLVAGAGLYRSRQPGASTVGWKTVGLVSFLASVELGCNLYAWIVRQSVRSASTAWWVQVVLLVAGYAMLRLACRSVTQGKLPSQEAAA